MHNCRYYCIPQLCHDITKLNKFIFRLSAPEILYRQRELELKIAGVALPKTYTFESCEF